VHTYKLINRAGKETYVKFHWKTKQGEAMLAELTGDFLMPACSQHLNWRQQIGGSHWEAAIFAMFLAGEQNLLDDDAVTVGGSNHSHATADLQVGSWSTLAWADGMLMQDALEAPSCVQRPACVH